MPVPVGGTKVICEYANRLVERGYDVSIVLPALEDLDSSIVGRAFNAARYVVRGLAQRYSPELWFRLHPSVRVKWVPSLREAHIPDADVVIATGWPTAECVASYGRTKGRKFYLIQHYETWYGPQPREQRLRATWKLRLHKVAIARWLVKIAEEMGESASYIPNGLDFAAFGCDVPISERERPHVAMLYHQFDWKGTNDGLTAMGLARAQVPELTATLFGVYPRPDDLPPWVNYVRNPRQRELRALYNRATVFVAPSWAEGWPLPPAEAMMCGAALVCTDIGGHQEYAVHERNALLAPARRPEALADKLTHMLTNKGLRHSLAETALADISGFTWEASVAKLEAILTDTQQAD